MDFVTPYLGASIVPVLAALLGASVSTLISHFLTKRRDAAAEKRQEARDIRTAERHARELEDQRREAADEQTRRDRIAAVKSYKAAYTRAFDGVTPKLESFAVRAVMTASREFALEIKPLNPTSSKLVHDLVDGVPFGEVNWEIAVEVLGIQRIEVFEELMTWAITDDRKAIRDAYRRVAQHYAIRRGERGGSR